MEYEFLSNNYTYWTLNWPENNNNISYFDSIKPHSLTFRLTVFTTNVKWVSENCKILHYKLTIVSELKQKHYNNYHYQSSAKAHKN